METQKYPINYHILAEDFCDHDGDRQWTQDETRWLLENLLKMCDAYDELIDQAEEMSYSEMPYSVGITETCERLARFATHDHAAAFIGTLPNHLDGIYFLDGPER